jgi:hypothetical protein
MPGARRLGLAVAAFAFGAQPQAIDVAADPAGQIPGQSAAVIGVLPLKFVGEEVAVDRAVMHLMAAGAGEHGGAVGVGQHRIGVRLSVGAAGCIMPSSMLCIE